MEGSDQRQAARREQRVPTDDGDDGLVDVRDVIAAVAKLGPQPLDGIGGQGHVRDGAVRWDADRAPQRDEPLGLVPLLRAGAAVQPPRARVVRVERREDPRLVPGRR